MHIYKRVYIYVYICVCVCVSVYIYIYMYSISINSSLHLQFVVHAAMQLHPPTFLAFLESEK